MASSPRIDELKKKFDENPRRYFAPLANEFRKAGDIEQAIVICEEFLPQQPGHMSGHIVYGQALYEAGRLPESRTVFETALALDPENLIALRHLGDIAHGQGDDSNARGWYLRVLDADPRNEEIQGLIAQLGGEEPAALAEEEAPATSAFAGLMDEPSPTPAPAREPESEPAVLEFAPEEMPLTPAAEPAHAELLDISDFAPPARPSTSHPTIDPSLVDTHPAGMPAIPMPTSESHAETAPAVDFIPAEFVPLSESVDSLPDLDTSMVEGATAFHPPAAPVEALEGLEASGGVTDDELAEARESTSMEAPTADEFGPLDLDEGDTTPAHGDVLEPEASAAYPPHERPQFDTPLSVAAHETPISVSAHETPLSLPAFETPISVPAVETPAAEIDEEIPSELPAAVIAAEAELTEEPAIGEQPVESFGATPAPFVTETMAELYLSQGLREQARSVYEQLLSSNPEDERLRGIVDSLSAAPSVVEDAGPSVRDFFSRLASRRPGARTAAAEPPSDADFAPDVESATMAVADEQELTVASQAVNDVLEQMPDTATQVEYAADVVVNEMAPTPATETRMQTPSGSIDALFGNRTPAKSEDSAAAALAQAFGGAAEEAPPLVGRPAHAATGELTLDSVFRDAPARAQRVSQNFSFDQFFAGGAVAGGERAGSTTPTRPSREIPAQDAAPAERTGEDIEQFNSWLQGLKPR